MLLAVGRLLHEMGAELRCCVSTTKSAAQDMNATRDNKSDLQLLKPYIHTAEERRALPILGDPDPETLWHLEIFYNAIAVAVERETGQMVSPMMKMSHEGFGRMVPIALVVPVFTTYLRRITSRNVKATLLHRDAFRQVAWLVDISPACTGGVVGQQLQGHHMQQR